MKTTLCLLSFLFCGIIISQAQQIDSVHQKKAEWIIERLASGKLLPEQITIHDSHNPQPHHYSFLYLTKRVEDGKSIHPVSMYVMVEDSLMDLEFTEDYGYINDSMRIWSYHYNIEKGELNWAYSYVPFPPKDPQTSAIRLDENTTSLYSNQTLDSTLMIHKRDSFWTYDKAELEKHKERDRRSFSFYEPKLLKSIDELYDLLNK